MNTLVNAGLTIGALGIIVGGIVFVLAIAEHL
jgi:hypothetical protein